MTGSGDPTRDRGDIMLASVILIAALVFGALALVSAGQAWGQRRNVQGTADAAARAAAQVSRDEVRVGSVIDERLAHHRATQVAGAAGLAVTSLVIDGQTVHVTVTGAVEYTFPTPGSFPSSMTATGTAVSQRGVVAGG